MFLNVTMFDMAAYCSNLKPLTLRRDIFMLDYQFITCNISYNKDFGFN